MLKTPPPHRKCAHIHLHNATKSNIAVTVLLLLWFRGAEPFFAPGDDYDVWVFVFLWRKRKIPLKLNTEDKDIQQRNQGGKALIPPTLSHSISFHSYFTCDCKYGYDIKLHEKFYFPFRFPFFSSPFICLLPCMQLSRSLKRLCWNWHTYVYDFSHTTDYCRAVASTTVVSHTVTVAHLKQHPTVMHVIQVDCGFFWFFVFDASLSTGLSRVHDWITNELEVEQLYTLHVDYFLLCAGWWLFHTVWLFKCSLTCTWPLDCPANASQL